MEHLSTAMVQYYGSHHAIDDGNFLVEIEMVHMMYVVPMCYLPPTITMEIEKDSYDVALSTGEVV